MIEFFDSLQLRWSINQCGLVAYSYQSACAAHFFHYFRTLYRGSHSLGGSWYVTRSPTHNTRARGSNSLPYLRCLDTSGLIPDDRVHAKWTTTDQEDCTRTQLLLMSQLNVPRYETSQGRHQAPAPANVGPGDSWYCCTCYQVYCTATTDYDAEIPLQLPSGHIFGRNCVLTWLSTEETTCPLCRFNLLDVDTSEGVYCRYLGEHYSACYILGASSEHEFAQFFVQNFSCEQVTISELALFPARSHTVAHRFFEALSSPHSAHPHTVHYANILTPRAAAYTLWSA